MKRWMLIAATLAAAVVAGVGASHASERSPATIGQSPDVALIVRERTPTSAAAEQLVRRLGGTVGRELPIVHGFSARLPAVSVSRLRAARAITAVWPDAQLHASEAAPDDLEQYDGLPPAAAWHETIGLPDVNTRYQGAGVAVALVDTGVASVADLGARVIERVDFTSERDGLDRYGHGTHMAGLIAGDGLTSSGLWRGAAPAADIVSVKVAGADGSTDVSTVLAGLQWVAGNEERLHIRVLNVCFGTDSTQSAAIDPLNYAVQQVWKSGVFVVVSAGNRGPAPGTVNKPGDDPYVLTVGAADAAGALANFSSRGPTPDGFAKPDLIAPGTSIVSIRVPGSTVDVARPAARIDDAYFKGTGTSQATAIVSGIAALLFEANPALTPDEAKTALTHSATPVPQDGAGAGLVDAKRALDAALTPVLPAKDELAPSTGLGSLEASRGSNHVLADPARTGTMTPLTGEVDVLGRPWDAKTWSASFWSALSWDPAVWAAASWGGWDAKTWSAKTWSAKTWSASTWN
jgi:serine protease AprX